MVLSLNFKNSTQTSVRITCNSEGPQGEDYPAYTHINLMVSPAQQTPEGVAVGYPITNITVNMATQNGCGETRGAGKADDQDQGLSNAQQFQALPKELQTQFWKVLKNTVDLAVERNAYTREEADFAFSKKAIEGWFNFHLNKKN